MAISVTSLLVIGVVVLSLVQMSTTVPVEPDACDQAFQQVKVVEVVDSTSTMYKVEVQAASEDYEIGISSTPVGGSEDGFIRIRITITIRIRIKLWWFIIKIEITITFRTEGPGIPVTSEAATFTLSSSVVSGDYIAYMSCDDGTAQEPVPAQETFQIP